MGKKVLEAVQSCKQLNSSSCLPALPSVACGFYLLGHKMAPASPRLKSLSQAGERRQGKGQNGYSSCALLLILENKAFLRGFCLYLIGQNLITLLSLNCREGWSPALLLSSAHSNGRQGKEVGMEDKGDTVSVTVHDTIRPMF